MEFGWEGAFTAEDEGTRNARRLLTGGRMGGDRECGGHEGMGWRVVGGDAAKADLEALALRLDKCYPPAFTTAVLVSVCCGDARGGRGG